MKEDNIMNELLGMEREDLKSICQIKTRQKTAQNRWTAEAFTLDYLAEKSHKIWSDRKIRKN